MRQADHVGRHQADADQSQNLHQAVDLIF
jgi:hypothetical protein